ncbi:MAG: hypothetical protein KDD15_06160, partial [Lewinella sp.]|nr:hypothetical protein [Lewinella sp.]
MKVLSLLLFSFLFINSALSQQVYSTAEGEQITWGSASFAGPSWGFYGQEIKLTEDFEVLSVSVYIYDHKDHDESKSQINFAVWSCGDGPSSELFLSEVQAIRKDQVGTWFEYKFPKPLILDAGTYL